MKNKHLTILILSLLSFSQTKAQYSLEIGTSYSSALQEPAMHLKFDSWFLPNFGAAVEFENYFLEGDNKWSTISFRVKFNFIGREQFKFFGFGGAQIINFQSEDVEVKSGETYNGQQYTTDYSLSGTKASEIGGHVGVGIVKFFNLNFKVFAETKMTFNPQLKDLTTFYNLNKNQFIPTVGIGYQF